MESKINNMQELTKDLVESYEKLKNNQLPLKDAKEIANVAGKIIQSCKVQLEYNVHIKSEAKIAFLES